jgi:hypothetical protein
VFAPNDVAASVTHLVSFEVHAIDTTGGLRSLTALREGAMVAVFRVETVIYIAVEILAAVKPWADANEDAPIEPLRTVISGGSTVIRRDVVVTVWTFRRYSNFDSDLGLRCRNETDDCSERRQKKDRSAH